MTYLIVFILLFAGMILYTRIANRFLIFDNPNARSSHTKPTIRGGGIVFLLAITMAVIQYHPVYWLPITGAISIGVISFLDDNFDLSQRLRLLVHFIAITLLFTFLPVYTELPIWAIAALYIFAIGIINAYNFMDGINGITGLYSLIVLGGIQYVNLYEIQFTEPDLIRFPMLACLVFLYYNFRVKAKVFAGDVGSITVAFWIVFLLLDLMFKTGDIEYILFLSVYGVDAVMTIVHRLVLKQNIMQPHRLHFYQILANERKVPHLVVATIYATVQCGINVFVLLTDFNFVLTAVVSTVPLAIIYVALKPYLMKHKEVREVKAYQESLIHEPASHH
jgi:UDP-N-acetylmuramyl pentapeptide phosphotransferase/UDP-N-acetylglucosamine-1-phosphate transferase